MTSRFRWHTKKLARKAMMLSSLATGYVTPHDAQGEPPVRVLTYHRFGNVGRDPFCVDPADFERQMAYLAGRQLAVSLAQFEDFVAGTSRLRHGAVLVTIDDGLRSLYTAALPVLRDYGIPSVAFVTTSLLRPEGLRPAQAPPPEGRLTWEELAELPGSGVAIGSHGHTHQSLGPMSDLQIEEEAFLSRTTLEQRTGRPVTAFAYPFGTRADFSDRAAAALRRTGYRCAFTSQHGTIHPLMDPFCLPRIKVEGGEALWLFKLLVRGGMDNWIWIDRGFSRWQATEHT